MPPTSEPPQGGRTAKPYVPALGYPALYDRVVAVTMREATWRAAFVRLVAPRAGERILDIGCGTGTLVVALAQVEPGAQITGIDPDDAMLAVARQRATTGSRLSWWVASSRRRLALALLPDAASTRSYRASSFITSTKGQSAAFSRRCAACSSAGVAG